MKLFQISLFFVLLINSILCHNILVFINAIGKSHLDFCDSLINSLTEKGHVVDYIIARMNDKVKGNGENNATRLYTFGFETESNWKKSSHLLDPFKHWSFHFGGFRQYTKISNELCEIALNDKKLEDFIKFRKYDVGLVSAFDYCATALFENAGIPSISSFNAIPIFAGQAVLAGLPNPASTVVPMFHQSDLQTFSGRFWNLLYWAYIHYIEIPEVRKQQKIIFEKRFGSNYDIDYIGRRTDIMFINSNEIMEKPRPISHQIQYIGGINLRKPKHLDNNMQQLLRISKKGTIIFSFGTQVGGDVYPRYAVRNFVEVFKKFKEYTFLWKYDIQEDEHELFKNAENIHVLSWLPQTDLLYDRRVICFISHVGLNSFNEASYAGVPILAIPLFADQPHNAENGEFRGTTYILDKTKLTKQNIEKGLEEIIGNPKYLENALKLKKMLVEKPENPKDRFVKWVEYTKENPGLHEVFEMPGTRMGVVEYYCIDVVMVSILIIISASFVIFKTCNTLTVRTKLKKL